MQILLPVVVLGSICASGGLDPTTDVGGGASRLEDFRGHWPLQTDDTTGFTAHLNKVQKNSEGSEVRPGCRVSSRASGRRTWCRRQGPFAGIGRVVHEIAACLMKAFGMCSMSTCCFQPLEKGLLRA